MPEAAPVFAEITASELRGSRGKVIAGIKTGAVEVGIYIRADSAAEGSVVLGGLMGMLNDLVGAGQIYIACGHADLRNGIGGFATLVQQKFRFSSVQRYAAFCSVVIGRTGTRGFIGKRMDLYWSRSGWRLEASSGLGTAQRLGG